MGKSGCREVSIFFHTLTLEQRQLTQQCLQEIRERAGATIPWSICWQCQQA